jgi:hypothetical protein
MGRAEEGGEESRVSAGEIAALGSLIVAFLFGCFSVALTVHGLWFSSRKVLTYSVGIILMAAGLGFGIWGMRVSGRDTDQIKELGRKNLELSQKNLELSSNTNANVTGGSSFPYLMIEPPLDHGRLHLAVINHGDSILTSVDVSIDRAFDNNCKYDPPGWKTLKNLNVGTLYPGEIRMLGGSLTPHTGCIDKDIGPYDMYNAIFKAQNGMVTESIILRPCKIHQWDRKIRVTRQSWDANHTNHVEDLMTRDFDRE